METWIIVLIIIIVYLIIAIILQYFLPTFEKLKREKKLEILYNLINILVLPVKIPFELVSKVFSGIATLTNDFLAKIKKKYITKPEIKKTQQLAQLMCLDIPLFEHSLSTARTNIFIYVLQGISFFTTWAGTKYYMSSVINIGGFDGALLFALVIQGIITFFSTSLYRSKKAGKIAVLVTAVIISISFSYIGMLNSSVKPYEKYAAIYDEKVYNTATLLKTNIEKASEDTFVRTSVNDFAEDIRSLYQEFEKITNTAENLTSDEETQRLDDEYSQIEEEEKNAIKNGYYANAYGTYDRKPATTLTESQINDKIAAKKRIKQAKQQQSTLNLSLEAFENEMSKITDSDDIVQTAKEKIEADTSECQVYIDDQNHLVDSANDLIKAINDYYKEIESGTKIDTVKPIHDAQYYQTRIEIQKGLNALQIKTSKEIIAEYNEPKEQSKIVHLSTDIIWKNGYNAISSFLKKLIPSATTDEYNGIVDALYESTQDYYLTFSNLVDSGAVDEDSLRKLSGAMTEFENREDPNVLGFTRIFEKDQLNHIIIPLLLAIIIDGLTLVLALFMNGRQDSLLHAKTNKELYKNEPHVLEQVFLAMNPDFIANMASPQQPGEFIKDFNEAVKNTVQSIQNYLALFEASPETKTLGCVLKVKAAVLSDENNKKYAPLSSTLLAFGRLVYLSKEEYAHVAPKQSPNCGYYFLKINTEMHLRKCITTVNFNAKLRYLLDDDDDDENESANETVTEREMNPV